MNDFEIGTVRVGSPSLFLIAGPCVIESEAHARFMAESIQRITSDLNVPYIFKASYDKANRTSASGFRGPGLEEGVQILRQIAESTGLPVITDVHSPEHCVEMAPHVDVLQIPAFLSRQTDLLVAAAKTGKIINVKKGQFLAPWDMKNVALKITESGNPHVMLCERGVSFGYNTLVNDMRALPIMAETGHPVVFDATHSVQQPGGAGTATSGDRRMVPYLARAAIAVGVAAVFMETHQDPDKAPSDGPNMVKLSDMPALLEQLVSIDRLIKSGAYAKKKAA